MSSQKDKKGNWTWDGRFPHCDHRILHEPGECTYCDEYAPMLQYIRKMWNINFTGHHDIENDNGVMSPCPAEVARPFDLLNRWGGNKAVTKEMLELQEKEMKEALKNIKITLSEKYDV